MPRTVAIGLQNFEKIISKNCFYIDKTGFIKEWWRNNDDVTLIARPRRFGKTLNMSMLDAFFSNRYCHQEKLFKELEIWKSESMRKIAGTYPVISLSFANVKENNYSTAVYRICNIIQRIYSEHLFLTQSEQLSDAEKRKLLHMAEKTEPIDAPMAINDLSSYLAKHFEKKVIILLDEYDTPMQEAYINGYWDEFTSFIRNLFNSTFKTNPYLERAVMTGITRVSKESIFSDLNNLTVITTTSKRYATAFGFTEQEVFMAMDEYGFSDKEGVKKWYDGFNFGNVSDIYNPWSIINYLKEGELNAYWANTSSNSLIGALLRKSSSTIKKMFEDLLSEKTIDVPVNEQIIYDNLDTSENAIWSLLLATGYLKVIKYQTSSQLTGNRRPIYTLALTNEEVRNMFCNIISGWFEAKETEYNDFIKALICGDVKAMNAYMKIVCESVFSYFDTGSGQDDNTPERFYHGFVLGLLVDMSEDYIVRSNRESGLGRYDVMIYPREVLKGAVTEGDAIIIEFKVQDSEKEKDLNGTVKAALKQIDNKDYSAELRALGFRDENIRKYGFAFSGKKVLIGE